MVALGSLLVQDQVVGVKQIEQALQHQVIHGGSLETNLLELGLVDEDLLAEYAARSRGMPVLLRELMNVPNQRAIKLLPWSTVEKNRVLPIRLENTRMIIAADEEPHSDELDEISFASNIRFDAYYVHEFRLAMGLNRHYGLAMSPRMIALQRRYEPDFERDQPPTVHPPSVEPGLFGEEAADRTSPSPLVGTARIVSIGPAADAEATSAPPQKEGAAARELPQPAQETVSQHRERVRQTAELYRRQERRLGAVESQVPTNSPPAPDEAHPGADEEDAPVILSLAEARKMLDEAETRDEILGVVVDFARQAFEFLVLLVVHGQMAQGRTAVWGRREKKRIDHLAIPLDQGGMFETAFETRSFYLGPPGMTEADQDVLKKMGRAGLRNCAILPVSIRHRVILLLYGDAGASGVHAEDVSNLARFCRYVSEAFERLLLRRKQSDTPGDGRPIAAPQKNREPLSLVAKFEAEISGSSKSGTGSGGVQAPPKAKTAQKAPEEPDAPKEKTSSWAGRYHVKSDQVAEKDRSSLVDELAPRRRGRKATARRRPSIEDLERSGHIGPPGFRDPIRQTRDLGVRTPDAADDEPLDLASEAVRQPKDEASPKTPTGNEKARGEFEPVKTAAVVNVGPVSPKNKDRSVIVEMHEEIGRLVERILRPGPFDEAAAELLIGIGDDALASLIQHFPGPLKYDRYQLGPKLPRVSFHGPLLKLLVRLGAPVTPHVQPLLESLDSDVRFYSTFLFSEITAPEALPALTGRLFDPDRQVRALAADVIRQHARFPEFMWTVRNLLEVLESMESKVDAKRLAAFALGELKVVEALRPLARMLGSADQGLVQAAHQALVKISFNDFGFSERRWLVWLDANNDRHRLEWAIASLEHSSPRIRAAAMSALKQAVGEEVEWPESTTDTRQMSSAKRQCESWWRKEGAAFHLIEGNK